MTVMVKDMHIPTIEEDFEYQFKELIKDMKKAYPQLANLSSDDLQDAIWEDKDICVEFAHKMIERAFDFGGDEMFEDEED